MEVVSNLIQSIIPIAIAILIFGLIVLVHELGHFLAAKRNGIKVIEFAIGMGPKLIYHQGKETVYTIRTLPIGGFCQMLGEDEDSENDRAFGNKSVMARATVLIMGAAFNFLLAFLCSALVAGFFGASEPVISELNPNYPMASSGAKVGDRITKLNNRKIHVYKDIPLFMMTERGEEISVEVLRDGQKAAYKVSPSKDGDGKLLLGIIGSSKTALFGSGVEGYEKLSFSDVLYNGFWDLNYYIRSVFDSLKMLFTAQISPKELSGPIGIVNIIADTYEESIDEEEKSSYTLVIANMLILTALISANLGVMNLLPFPALDGGRLIFVIIEGIRGKPVDKKFETIFHLIGMGFLLLLMLYAVFNDVGRLLS